MRAVQIEHCLELLERCELICRLRTRGMSLISHLPSSSLSTSPSPSPPPSPSVSFRQSPTRSVFALRSASPSPRGGSPIARSPSDSNLLRKSPPNHIVSELAPLVSPRQLPPQPLTPSPSTTSTIAADQSDNSTKTATHHRHHRHHHRHRYSSSDYSGETCVFFWKKFQMISVRVCQMN
jgi:hypothetical protein